MLTVRVEVPGEEPRRIVFDRPVLTMGRSSLNDVVISDKSLSRQHIRLVKDGDEILVEDLGSRNGTFVNGERLTALRPLHEGDRVTLGVCTVTVSRGSTTQVQIDPGERFDPMDATVFRAEASALRAHPHRTDPNLPATQLAKLVDSLRIVSEMTLELLHDIPVNDMLNVLLDKVFARLHPERAVILLRQGGRLEVAIARTADGVATEEIRISQTLVSTVVEKRQGLLVIDAGDASGLAGAQSIRISGVRSILAAPMENGGEVVGLIYLDSRIGAAVFAEDDLRLLTSLANVVAAKIQNVALEREAADKKRMDRDFSLAREIQEKLLPEEAPILQGFELLGTNRPSREVSGDYFDFRRRPDGKLYTVIADVVGKGVGPALLMAWLQATFSAWADQSLGLAEMVTRLSENLAARTAEGRFITAFFCLIDGVTGEIEYVNAGHNPPIIARASGADILKQIHGRPLALFPRPYESSVEKLEPGDFLFLYTDGLSEAANAAEEEFGLERLKAFVAAHRTDPPEQFDLELNAVLEEFVGGAQFADDRTVIMIRRNPAA